MFKSWCTEPWQENNEKHAKSESCFTRHMYSTWMQFFSICLKSGTLKFSIFALKLLALLQSTALFNWTKTQCGQKHGLGLNFYWVTDRLKAACWWSLTSLNGFVVDLAFIEHLCSWQICQLLQMMLFVWWLPMNDAISIYAPFMCIWQINSLYVCELCWWFCVVMR